MAKLNVPSDFHNGDYFVFKNVLDCKLKKLPVLLHRQYRGKCVTYLHNDIYLQMLFTRDVKKQMELTCK